MSDTAILNKQIAGTTALASSSSDSTEDFLSPCTIATIVSTSFLDRAESIACGDRDLDGCQQVRLDVKLVHTLACFTVVREILPMTSRVRGLSAGIQGGSKIILSKNKTDP